MQNNTIEKKFVFPKWKGVDEMRKEFFLAALFSVGFSISALASEIALQPDFGAYTLSIDTAEETTAKFSSAKMEQTILTFCQTASERGVAQDTYLLTVQKGSYITVICFGLFRTPINI
mgnify:CR=1 FL=1